jgi:hypothetical protein
MPMGSAVSLGKLSWVHSKVMAKWISHIRFLCMFKSWESSDSGVYVLLSNVYSVNDRWTDVKRARGLMYEEEMHKELGSNELMCIGKPVNSYSWDVGCSVHSNEAISFWGPVVLLTNNWFSLNIEITSTTDLKKMTRDLSGYCAIPKASWVTLVIKTNTKGLHIYGSCFSLLCKCITYSGVKAEWPNGIRERREYITFVTFVISWLCSAWTGLQMYRDWLMDKRDLTLRWFE